MRKVKSIRDRGCPASPEEVKKAMDKAATKGGKAIAKAIEDHILKNMIGDCSDANPKVQKVTDTLKFDSSTANPKDLIGSTKANLTLISPIALAHCADAMLDGAGKYGPYNWREKRITLMNYIAAALRHLQAFQEGQRCAGDSGAHHLGHAMASCAILLDAEAHGCLIDDRPKSDGGAAYDKVLTIVKDNEAKRKAKRG